MLGRRLTRTTAYNKAANVPGAHLAFTAAPFYDERADWDKLAVLTGVGGLENDGALPPAFPSNTCADPVNSVIPTGLPTLPLAPGDVRKRQMWSGRADADYKTNYANYPWYKYPNLTYLTVARNIRPYDRFFEFEKLGTYVLYYHVSGQRSSTATLKPSQTFCDTARYVFHVGPVADLAVKANSVSSGYSVSAMNHGPDPAENAQVKLNVTGAQNAKASVGCFDPSTGVWGLSRKLQGGKCVDVEYTRLPGAPDPRFHPGDTATLTFTGNYASITADIYNKEQCVNNEGAVQSATTELACIYSDTTTTPPTRSGNHWGSYQACVVYDSANPERTADYVRVVNNARLAIANENQCKVVAQGGKTSNTYDVGTVYDYDERNNSATLGRAPGAVGSLTASRDSATKTTINVSWTAPGGAPAPTGYDVEYQSRAGNIGAWSGWVRAATEATGTTYALANAGGGTGYRFQVRAVTASNPDNLTGSWRTSNTVNPLSNPNQVATLTATRNTTTPTTINVVWTAPSSGTTPTGYDVEYQTRTGNSGSWGAWTSLATMQTTLTYDLTTATGANSYRFGVRTVTVTGGDTIMGSWRTSSVVRAFNNPDQVQNLTATRDGLGTTINLSWTAPTGGTPVTGYQVQYLSRTGNSGAWGAWTPDPVPTTQTGTTYTLPSVTGANSYQFQVRTVTVSGNGAIYGSWKTASIVRAFNNPDQVQNLTATRDTANDTIIDVTWVAPTGTTPAPTHYEVQYQVDGRGDWLPTTPARQAAPDVTYQVTSTDGITGASSYRFRVRTVAVSGGSDILGGWAYSNTVAKTPAPGQAQNLTATRAANETIIDATWAAPASNGTAPTHYDVQYQVNGGNWTPTTPDRQAESDKDYRVTDTGGSAANRTYRFRVRSVTVSNNVAINGSWAYSNTVPRLTAPSQVSNLTATRVDTEETEIDVTWTAPNNATGATTYDVQHKQDNASDWHPATPTPVAAGTTTYTLNNAAGGSRYVFRVRGVTTLSGGSTLEGSWQTSSVVRGLPAGAIGAVTATRNGSDPTRIDVSWDASARATGYDVQYRQNSGSWRMATKTGQNVRTHTQTNAGGVETYQFRVRGVSDAGNGAWTDSATVQPPPVGWHGADVGVDYITLKVTSGPWWFDYRDHKADWSSCKRVASGSHTVTNLRPERTHLFDLYTSSGCSADQLVGRQSLRTLSDAFDWSKCWNADDCRDIDNPNDVGSHTHKRSRLAQIGVTISGCDHSTRVFHDHGWPDGGGGRHWHCQID